MSVFCDLHFVKVFLLQLFDQKIFVSRKLHRDLDPNKAHGHGMISIRIVKICGESILKPLEIVFKSCIENDQFPNEWKKQMWFQSIKR